MTTNVSNTLPESIPANNIKIIEIYNKLRSSQWVVNTKYQRKLVWKPAHKVNFIDTILRNYPFPEIYLAPGNLDQANLILVDEIVDGQQRLSTIKDYIEGTDVFSKKQKSIKLFKELDHEEKARFLNYEVSVRYLKNVAESQITEIFQRINKTDYALNTAERLNAQWGSSEFVCFAKQIVDPEFDIVDLEFVVDAGSRDYLAQFFNGNDDEDSIFSGYDKSRMLSYQYVMTLIATLDSGTYFQRNEKVQHYIENFNDTFPQAIEILEKLMAVVRFISDLNISRQSRWYKKASMFSLIVELYRSDLQEIDRSTFESNLKAFDEKSARYDYGDLDHLDLTPDEVKYLDFSKEAVNEKRAREFRGEFIRKIIGRSQSDKLKLTS